MANESSTSWSFPLIAVKEDKAGDRTTTPPGSAYELVGVDGQHPEGLRPFPGFRKIDTLTLATQVENADMFKGFVLTYPNLQRGYLCYAFVDNASSKAVFAGAYIGSDLSFTQIQYFDSGLAANVDVSPKRGDVCVVKTTAFFTQGGTAPIAFSFGPTTDGKYTAGPGNPPTLTLGSTLTLNAGGGGALLDPGDYAFAIQYSSTISDRLGAISNICVVQEADFGGAAKRVEVNTTFPTGFDQVSLYRSPRTQDGGGAFAGAFLFTDSVGTTLPKRYGFKDLELVYQDQYEDQPLFLAQLHKADACMSYEGTLILSHIQDSYGGPSNGRIEWSSLKYPSPELFNPSSYYQTVPGTDPICFHECAGNVFGFGFTKLFHIRKEGGYIKVQEMHEGMGIVNKHAADVVGSLVYYVNQKGLYAVDGNGQLDAVHALDYLLSRDWQASLNYVWVAFDPVVGALCILNTYLEQMAVVWFKTSRVTEVYDCRFCGVARMKYYSDPADATSPVVERAVFVGKQGDLYVINWDRFNPNDTIRMMPTNNDAIVSVTAASSVSVPPTITVNGTAPTYVKNAKLYELDGPLAGRSHKIKSISGQTITIDATSAGSRPNVGVTVGISPVYTRWVGHPIGLQTEDGAAYGGLYDYFRVRHISSMCASFIDVQGNQAGSQWARWRGGVWKGAETSPALTAFPQKRDGTFNFDSVRNGPSRNGASFGNTSGSLVGKYGYDATIVAPAVEVFCPDLDYKLLCVKVDGKVTSTFREQMGE